MNKKERLLHFLKASEPQSYVPAAFFLHFGAEYHSGMAAVQRHAEFFRATDMDFVKIQLELPFPRGHVASHKDWANVPLLTKEFFESEIQVVRGILAKLGSEALVIVTLYSPYMVAVRLGGEQELNRAIVEDPESAKQGIEIAGAGLMTFVDECIKAGVDGFYHSTQGGEPGRFANPNAFLTCIKPFDLQVMREIESRCRFNVLHICDYERSLYGGYPDLTPFQDYPGHVVNCSLDGRTAQQVSQFFSRPFMGGMDRLGVLATGSESEIVQETARVIANKSDRFILGADCTVPADTPWGNLRAAIDTAHATLTAGLVGGK